MYGEKEIVMLKQIKENNLCKIKNGHEKLRKQWTWTKHPTIEAST